MASSETGGRAVHGTQALDRAAELVDTVVRADAPVGSAELQEVCGLAKSTASRMLTALERHGLVARDDTGGYVAGSLFWLYAARHDPWEETIRIARPEMERLGELTRETVHLSVVLNDQVAQVAQVDAQYLLGSRDWTEVRLPMHASAMGKVFHAWGAVAIADETLEPLTSSTITLPATLLRDAELSRRRGWALSRDELEVGLTGLAVPVRGNHGNVVAALGISGPTPRLEHGLVELARHLSTHADRLSALLRRSSGRAPKEGVA